MTYPKTVVITGGTSGLGLITARHLASAGNAVVVVGRDRARAEAAVAGFPARTTTGAPTIPPRTYVADLSRMSRVREVAERMSADGLSIDVLINNAGAAFPRYEETEDGLERAYAINHHAPFLLTHSLIGLGALEADARVVNLSTFVEKRGRLDRTAPEVTGTSWRRRYSQLHVYATSKLASLLATSELAQRLPAGMSIYSANPGMVRDTSINRSAGGLMRWTAPLFKPFAITPAEGIRTVVHLAEATPAPEPSGGYFSESRPAMPSRQAQDPLLARAVYARTAALLGVEPLVAVAG
ncbi:SDR family NAD(P)-dependent oxidoreductase [Nocardia sp. NPDC005998]|uniref:SDR family NAD(P)-dependent oxidoreductase n=1 Tax=Nocardia sp. NPDC005998 TaxID=3156894 RepID=UPI0033AFDDE9